MPVADTLNRTKFDTMSVADTLSRIGMYVPQSSLSWKLTNQTQDEAVVPVDIKY